jgi:hypothetical protein
VRGVVEGPLQAGKHAGHQVAQPVDHAHPVSDQIFSMSGQHGEVAHEVGTGVDDLDSSRQFDIVQQLVPIGRLGSFRWVVV